MYNILENRWRELAIRLDCGDGPRVKLILARSQLVTPTELRDIIMWYKESSIRMKCGLKEIVKLF